MIVVWCLMFSGICSSFVIRCLVFVFTLRATIACCSFVVVVCLLFVVCSCSLLFVV